VIRDPRQFHEDGADRIVAVDRHDAAGRSEGGGPSIDAHEGADINAFQLAHCGSDYDHSGDCVDEPPPYGLGADQLGGDRIARLDLLTQVMVEQGADDGSAQVAGREHVANRQIPGGDGRGGAGVEGADPRRKITMQTTATASTQAMPPIQRGRACQGSLMTRSRPSRRSRARGADR
jgi:hypothetical protein